MKLIEALKEPKIDRLYVWQCIGLDGTIPADLKGRGMHDLAYCINHGTDVTLKFSLAEGENAPVNIEYEGATYILKYSTMHEAVYVGQLKPQPNPNEPST